MSARETLIREMMQLSPVEERSGRWYKREDLFAPFGAGGPNGSKLRQLIWLLDREKTCGARRIVTACSVLSPQGPMTATVAAAMGMPCTVIHGATHYDAAIRHPYVRMSSEAGAELEFIAVGYNPALQRAARDYAERRAGSAILHYGITTAPDEEDGEVARFHEVGAAQVQNIPDTVKTLVIPMGSANSITSIMLGLARNPPKALERIIRVQIGPDRKAWHRERLEKIEGATGLRILDAPYAIEHHDLHGSKWAKYSDRMPERRDGIAFHPTYEGKVVRYLDQIAPEWWTARNGETMLWIVGGDMR